MTYNSEGNLYGAGGMQKFELLIRSTAKNILESQGFDMSSHEMKYTEMWVQEFSSKGGGHHETHVHWNIHVSGFYFFQGENFPKIF